MGRSRRSDEFILDVARLRYDQRLSQTEIATRLQISESTVSRALKQAMDFGFVEVQISPYGRRDVELERALQRAFDLRHAVVVRGATASASLRTLGSAVAGALAELIVAGDVIGISDGKAAAAIANGIGRARTSDIDVVSLIGGIGAPEISTHSAEICRIMADSLNARVWQLPVPAVVEDREAAHSLRRIASVKAIFDLMERSTITLLGIGAMSPEASVFRYGMIDGRSLPLIEATGAVGSICARFFDRGGAPISTEVDERVMAMSFDALKRVPLRFGTAVGPEKLVAIRAAIHGGLINALGTDSDTAASLLDR